MKPSCCHPVTLQLPGWGHEQGAAFTHRRMRVPLLFFMLWLWAAYSSWLSSETKENVNVVVELSVLVSNGRGKQCFRKSTNIKNTSNWRAFFFFPLTNSSLYFEYSSFPLSENGYFQNPFRLQISIKIMLSCLVIFSVQQHSHVVVIKCKPLSWCASATRTQTLPWIHEVERENLKHFWFY